MRLANLDVHEGLGQRLRTLVMGRSGQPTSVGEIMSHPVRVVEEAQHAIDLVSCARVFAGPVTITLLSLTPASNWWVSSRKPIWCACWRAPCRFRKSGTLPLPGLLARRHRQDEDIALQSTGSCTAPRLSIEAVSPASFLICAPGAATPPPAKHRAPSPRKARLWMHDVLARQPQNICF